MILIITGNGKGKTTSAIGTAIRSIGWGKKTSMVCFDKGGSHYGEQQIFNLLQEKIDIFRFGKKRFDEKTKTFRLDNTNEDMAEIKKAIDKDLDLLGDNYHLIICDELITCLDIGLIDKESTKNLIDKCPSTTNLILTGRNAPGWLIKKADLVSEVKEVKHYLKKTGKTIKGLDY